MAQHGDLLGYAMLFVLVGITIGIGVYVVTQTQTQLGAGTTLGNAAFQNATKGMSDLASWLPIVAIVVAAGVVLYLVFSSLQGSTR